MEHSDATTAAPPADAGALDVPADTAGRRWVPYVELTKPGLSSLVVATSAVGYVLGAAGAIDWFRLLCTVVGTGLVAGSASVLNQCWEVPWDRRMERTRRRPLPSRRLSVPQGLVFGLALAVFGEFLLAGLVGWPSAVLALLTLVIYVVVYTPLKRRTTLCTLVGAIVGATPPVIGWSAAGGVDQAGPWILFALLFIWQIPHFLAIAWLYRADYSRSGFRMLPVVDPTGRATCGMVLVYTLALLPVSVAVGMVGLAGWVYLAGAMLLGIGFLFLGARLYVERTVGAARRVFVASITYLPLLLLLMVFDPTTVGRYPF